MTTAENPWTLSELPPGLVALVGDESAGKTTWLQCLSGGMPSVSGPEPQAEAVWLDLRLPQQDEDTPLQVWAQLRAQHPRWNPDLHGDLVQALSLEAHVHKRLNMLSAGTRRKVMLIAALASGASVTLLDQPFVALDMASIQVVLDFLHEAADHPERAWIVADYEAPSDLHLADLLHLR